MASSRSDRERDREEGPIFFTHRTMELPRFHNVNRFEDYELGYCLAWLSSNSISEHNQNCKINDCKFKEINSISKTLLFEWYMSDAVPRTKNIRNRSIYHQRNNSSLTSSSELGVSVRKIKICYFCATGKCLYDYSKKDHLHLEFSLNMKMVEKALENYQPYFHFHHLKEKNRELLIENSDISKMFMDVNAELDELKMEKRKQEVLLVFFAEENVRLKEQCARSSDAVAHLYKYNF